MNWFTITIYSLPLSFSHSLTHTHSNTPEIELCFVNFSLDGSWKFKKLKASIMNILKLLMAKSIC